MKTLIIPCAGKSSRFPNLKPKWLLTYPTGELMIERCIHGINLDIFDQIIITIVKEHDQKYNAYEILSQIFINNKKVKILVLDDFTKSASETIFRTINHFNIKGNFAIKDCDNYIKINLSNIDFNFAVGVDLNKYPNISQIANKSFLKINYHNQILNIVEKKVISDIICVGLYAFKSSEDFIKAYNELLKSYDKELFVSYIISHLITKHLINFTYLEAKEYEDWGTLEEWQAIQEKYKTLLN